MLPDRLLAAMRELNPVVPAEYLVQAQAAILAPQSRTRWPKTIGCIRSSPRAIVASPMSIIKAGTESDHQVASQRPDENELLAVQQVTIRNREYHRRFDVVLYLNGLPVTIIELKQAGWPERRWRRRAPSSADVPA